MMHRPSRPVGITILAILEILIGIVGLLASFVIIGFSALFATLPTVGSLLGAVGLVLDSRDDFQYTLTARGRRRADNRSDHRWGRRIGLLGSDAVLSDEDSCESLLRKGRITNHSWQCNAIFARPTDQQPANSSK